MIARLVRKDLNQALESIDATESSPAVPRCKSSGSQSGSVTVPPMQAMLTKALHFTHSHAHTHTRMHAHALLLPLPLIAYDGHDGLDGYRISSDPVGSQLTYVRAKIRDTTEQHHAAEAAVLLTTPVEHELHITRLLNCAFEIHRDGSGEEGRGDRRLTTPVPAPALLSAINARACPSSTSPSQPVSQPVSP